LAELHAADRLVAPSYYLAHSYKRYGLSEDDIEVVPHGVDVPDVARTVSEHVRFGFIGPLSPAKGLRTLCRAFAEVDEATSLTLFGPCSDPRFANELMSMAEGITWAGPFPHADLGITLAVIDVLVVPSCVAESFSLVAEEAIAAGVPLIASRIGALPERIREGHDGLLVPPGDSGALAQALHAVATGMVHLAASTRRAVSLDAHIDALLRLYADVSNQRSRAATARGM
jgi:glycosyltransferase involved in cell wall biosynthesis